MRRFLQKTIDNIEKMDRNQISLLVREVDGETALLGLVLETMTDGVVVSDQDHRILLISKSAERMIPFFPGERHERLIWESIDDEEIADLTDPPERSNKSEKKKKEIADKIKQIKLDWEKTSGIPKILLKHLKPEINKFIVFCKDQDHLDKMEVEVQRWFQKAGTHRWRKVYLNTWNT